MSVGKQAGVALAATAAVALIALIGSACAELRRGVGDDCLKNDDCVTNVCASQKCATSPPVLPPSVLGFDAGTDAPSDAGAPDAASPEDAPTGQDVLSTVDAADTALD